MLATRWIKKVQFNILNEEFMMNIFIDFLNELPPLAEYCKYMFEEKLITRVAQKNQIGCTFKFTTKISI